jgi:hypothetical protein
MKDRSEFYKTPMKFGAQTMYESDILANIDLKHWEEFDKKVTEDKSYKIGDIIDNSVRVTAIQLVEFLDQFTSLSSIEEVKAIADKYINEIQKEIKL